MSDLSNLTDQELNELAAVECMGWIRDRVLIKDIIIGDEEVDAWLCIPMHDKQKHPFIPYLQYNPCQNAEQAMDLAEKYSMNLFLPIPSINTPALVDVFSKDRQKHVASVSDTTWRRAVVIAAILSEKGE